jgi:hypothetical protein
MLTGSQKYSLYMFCDACKSSYTAGIFLRSKNGGQVSVHLLQAISRVAPLKQIIVLRLELLACCIGACLSAFVKRGIDIEDDKEYFWTDSSTALHWIKKEERWGTFVGNRGEEIRTKTRTADWRHVPGQENPADLPSQGCTVSKLVETKWWEGLSWLRLAEENWPRAESTANEEEVNHEKKKGIVTLLAYEGQWEAWYLTYFSKCNRILRMVAWMLRFANNAQRTLPDRAFGELSVDEISVAEKVLVRIVQREVFTSDEIPRLKSLQVFEDKEGILHMRTKIIEQDDMENFKYPVLLPSDHKLVTLFIQEHHLRLLHAGLHTLLSKLRDNFWILRGRTDRQVLSRCIRCKRHEQKEIQVVPGTLPEDRVRDASVLKVTGGDLTRPLFLKEERKGWIIMFTSAVNRAIHLELVTSLSTKGFLLGLRRFIAHREHPKVLYSDNGAKFVGADNLFKTIDWAAVEVDASVWRIQ